MHRNQVLSLISEYENRSPKESETILRFKTFVQKNPNCFKRSLKIGHITGSAWLVNTARNKVLLTHHRKLNRWLQLGGHADGEADVFAVALREVFEESGLEKIKPLTKEIFDLDIHLIPERGKEVEHEHFDVRFLFEAEGSEKLQLSEESNDLAWVPIESIAEFTQEVSILRMKNKWLSKCAGAGIR